MIQKEVIIASEKCLRARPIIELVKKARTFKSNISIIYKNKKADAKSLINVLALSVPKGATITISASGEDETFALNQIVDFVESLKIEE